MKALNVALLVVALALVACGKKIDEQKLQGVWKLERIEGPGSMVKAFKVEGNKISPLMTTNRFDCPMTFEIKGDKIVTQGNSSGGCQFRGEEWEVDSLTDSELVIKIGDEVKFIFKKSTERDVLGTSGGGTSSPSGYQYQPSNSSPSTTSPSTNPTPLSGGTTTSGSSLEDLFPIGSRITARDTIRVVTKGGQYTHIVNGSFYYPPATPPRGSNCAISTSWTNDYQVGPGVKFVVDSLKKETVSGIETVTIDLDMHFSENRVNHDTRGYSYVKFRVACAKQGSLTAADVRGHLQYHLNLN